MYNNELYHFGVKGMRWGHRKNNYKSTSIRSAMARRENNKVDKGFKDWNENAKKRDNAIELGKKQTHQEELMKTISPIKVLNLLTNKIIKHIKKL